MHTIYKINPNLEIPIYQQLVDTIRLSMVILKTYWTIDFRRCIMQSASRKEVTVA